MYIAKVVLLEGIIQFNYYRKERPCCSAFRVAGLSLFVGPGADGGVGWCLQNASQFLKHLIHGNWKKLDVQKCDLYPKKRLVERKKNAAESIKD